LVSNLNLRRYMGERINVFLAGFADQVAALTDEDFMKTRRALVDSGRACLKSLLSPLSLRRTPLRGLT
jgi:hypothetical protein